MSSLHSPNDPGLPGARRSERTFKKMTNEVDSTQPKIAAPSGRQQADVFPGPETMKSSLVLQPATPRGYFSGRGYGPEAEYTNESSLGRKVAVGHAQRLGNSKPSRSAAYAMSTPIQKAPNDNIASLRNPLAELEKGIPEEMLQILAFFRKAKLGSSKHPGSTPILGTSSLTSPFNKDWVQKGYSNSSLLSSDALKSQVSLSRPGPANAILEDAKAFGINDQGDLTTISNTVNHHNILRQKIETIDKNLESVETTMKTQVLVMTVIANGGTVEHVLRILNSPNEVRMTGLKSELGKPIAKITATAQKSYENTTAAPVIAKVGRPTNARVPVTLSQPQIGAVRATVNELRPDSDLESVSSVVSDLELRHEQAFSMTSELKNGAVKGVMDFGQATTGNRQQEGEQYGNSDDNHSYGTASLDLEEDLDDMPATIHGGIPSNQIDVDMSSVSEDSLTNSTLPDMPTSLEHHRTPNQLSFARRSGTSYASGNSVASESTLGGLGGNGSEDDDDDDDSVSCGRAELVKEDFSVSEDDEGVLAADRKNRQTAGKLGKAPIAWWKALKRARAETEHYAARKEEYKKALHTQCEYVDRLEEENEKLAALQREKSARIVSLEKELMKIRHNRA